MLMVVGVTMVAPAPAEAQVGDCPGPGVSAASVDVVSPRPGEQVRGVVTVRGRVTAALSVSRVELLVGRSMVDSRTFPATSSADFNLSWDASRASPGEASLRVVACGQGVGGVLVHGSSTVVVQVAAPVPTTQAPTPPTSAGSTTTIRSTSTSGPAASSTSSTSSTTSTSTTSTTSTTLPDVTTTQPPLGVAAREVGPPGRLLAARSKEDEPRSRPLWVGAVVGVAGVAGLVFSRTLPGRWLRRPGKG